MQIKKHELSKEQITHVESCEPKKDEPPLSERRTFAVREYFSYEVNGRVFAYRLVCYIVFVEDGVITERAGAAVVLHYFDEDGDGTFEMRCGAKGVENLPKWVKSYAAALSNNGLHPTAHQPHLSLTSP